MIGLKYAFSGRAWSKLHQLYREWMEELLELSEEKSKIVNKSPFKKRYKKASNKVDIPWGYIPDLFQHIVDKDIQADEKTSPKLFKLKKLLKKGTVPDEKVCRLLFYKRDPDHNFIVNEVTEDEKIFRKDQPAEDSANFYCLLLTGLNLGKFEENGIANGLSFEADIYVVDLNAQKAEAPPNKKSSRNRKGTPIERKSYQVVKQLSNTGASEAGLVEVLDGYDSIVRLEKVYVKRSVEEELLLSITNSDSAQLFLVTAEAGFGKTSLLWSLYSELCNVEGFDVIFLKAIHINREEITHAINYVKTIKKQAILLLDTLDSIMNQEVNKDQLLSVLQTFYSMGCIMIATSRIQEARMIDSGLRLSQINVKKFPLNNFDTKDELPKAVEKYVGAYCKPEDVENIASYKERILTIVANGRSMLQICQNPLTLRMLFSVYAPLRVPEEINVFQLYRLFWQNRVIEDKRPGMAARTDMPDMNENLSNEAYALSILMISKGKPEISIGDLESLIELKGYKIKNLELLRSRGVVKISQEKTVQFFHQTFLEHCGARAVFYVWKKKAFKNLGKRLLDHKKNSFPNHFLRPVFEQLLLLETGLQQSDKWLERLLNSEKSIDHKSGLYVFLLRESVAEYLSNLLSIYLSEKKYSSQTIRHFMQVASSIIPSRTAELFSYLELIWDRDKNNEQVGLISLLARYFQSEPDTVADFIETQNILNQLIEGKAEFKSQIEKQQILKAGHFMDIFLEICFKMFFSNPAKYYPQLISLLERLDFLSYREQIIVFLVSKKESILPLSSLLQDLNQALNSAYKNVENNDNIDRKVLVAMQPLWLDILKKSPSTESLAKILDDRSPLSFQCKLLALREHIHSLANNDIVAILNVFKVEDDGHRLKQWGRLFFSELLSEDILSNSSQQILAYIIEDIHQWLLGAGQREREKRVAIYLEAFRYSEFYLKDHFMPLIDTWNDKETESWFEHEYCKARNAVYINFISIVITSTVYSEPKNIGYILSKISNCDSKQLEQLVDAVSKLTIENPNTAELYLEILFISQKSLDRILKLFNYHIPRYSGMKEILRRYQDQLEELVWKNINNPSGRIRYKVVKLLGEMIKEDLCEAPEFRKITELMKQDKEVKAQLNYLDILGYYEDLPYEKFLILLDTLMIYSSVKTLTVREKAQIHLVKSAIETHHLLPDSAKIMKIILTDFNLDRSFKKVRLAPAWITKLSMENMDLAIEQFVLFFQSRELKSVPNQSMLKKIPHIFRGCMIDLFRNSQDKHRLELLALIPGLHPTLSKMIIYGFFHNPSVFLRKKPQEKINSFLADSNIDDEIKTLINQQQEMKLKNINTETWPELYESFVSMK